MHRYHFCHGEDADYIVWESLERVYDSDGSYTMWTEHARWMVPGSQLED